MKLLLTTILLLISTNLVFSQEIDCAVYQSQVDDLTSEINNATKALDKATNSLNMCHSFNAVVNSDDYQRAIAIKDTQINTKQGINWNDSESLK